MGTKKTVPSRRNLIIAAITILVLVAGVWWFMSGPGGVPEEATRVADRLPAETSLLVWTTDLGTLLSVAMDAGFDGETLAKDGGPLSGLVETLGHNPMTTDGLAALGVDVSGPLAFFLGPMGAPDLLLGLYIPLNDAEGVALAQDLAKKLGVADKIDLEKVEVAGRSVAWVKRKEGRAAGALVAAIVDIEGGALLVFPFDFKSRHAERIGAAIQAWATVLAEGPKETLADVDAFRPALAGYSGGLLGAFFNPSDGAREINLEEDGIQMVFWILASAKGAGFSLADDGPALRLQLRTVFTSADVAPGMDRDTAVLDQIPGRPIAGLHLAIDLEKAIAELERSLPKEAFKSHSLVSAIEASGPVLGLGDSKTAVDLVNGEFGFFLSETEASLPSLMKAAIGFIGIRDREAAESTLERLLDGTGMLAGKDTVEGATLFTLEGPFGEAGVLVTDQRIWFGGSTDSLRGVARGEDGELTGGERNKEIAGVMREDSAVAVFVDLEKVVALLPDSGDSPAREILADLDYLTLSARHDGATVESEAVLFVKGESFRKTMLPKLISTIIGRVGSRQEKSVAVGRYEETVRKPTSLSGFDSGATRAEAHDALDRMYRGASHYFETPRVNEYGHRIDCRFPAPAPWTPAGSCCGSEGGPDADGDGRCDSDPYAWSLPTWSALMFERSDPHRCVYSFESGGTGKDAWFKAQARCDRDCDGETANYSIEGRADPASSPQECLIRDGRALFVEDQGE